MTAPAAASLLLAALGGCLAGALLAAGVPRLIAAVAALQGDPALALIRAGERPTAAGVARIVDGRAMALEWAPDGRAQVEIGAVLLALAEPADAAAAPGAAAGKLFTGAAARLRAGLARAPADPQAWYLLATASAVLERPGEAVRSLRMSFRADPHTTRFGSARILLGVRLWDGSDRNLRASVLREMRTWFRLQPGEAMQTALRTGSLPLLRQALAGDAEDAQGLEVMLEDYRAASVAG